MEILANVDATAFDRRMMFESDCCDPFDLLTPPASPAASGRCTPDSFASAPAPRFGLEDVDAPAAFLSLGLDVYPPQPMALEDALESISRSCFHDTSALELTPPASPMGSGRCSPEPAAPQDDLFGLDFTPMLEMDDTMSFASTSAPNSAPASPALTGHDLPAWAAALSSQYDNATELDFLDDMSSLEEPIAAMEEQEGPSRKRARVHSPAPAKPKRKPRAVPVRRGAMPAAIATPAMAATAMPVAASMRHPMSAVTQKRDQHNVSERMRRQGLKLSFEELRCQVPSLEQHPTAHTGQILEGAVAYIRQLQQEEAELIRAKADLAASFIRTRAAFPR